MTNDKVFERDIRVHMEKTGAAYAAARHYLLDHHHAEPEADEPALAPAVTALPPRAADPGMSDEAIRRGTGKTWDELFQRLDEWGAAQRTHPEIAIFAEQEFGVTGWWAQTITVGYERARGMRKKHERTDGYTVSVSRTFDVPLERLFHLFADEAERVTWLKPELIRFRTLTQNKAWRCEMVEDGSRIEVRFTSKTPEKTSVSIQQTRLVTEEHVPAWRAFWKERLDRLAATFA
jgi:hypothetical protein